MIYILTKKIDAPCKVNLALDILSRREDGYHELDMVMQSISLCDSLSVEVESDVPPDEDGLPGLHLGCDTAGVPLDSSNIILRCAREFIRELTATQREAFFGKDKGLRFYLEKHIPMMAGLGGGSADGAAALLLLVKICVTEKSPLTFEKLCEIGLRSGADIPFCLRGGIARVSGIGQTLSDLPALPDCHFVIIKPKFSVHTGRAFAAWDFSQGPCRFHAKSVAEALKTGSLPAIAAAMGNSMEALLGEEEGLELLRFKKLLRKNGALGSVMSGSGSSVFGLFDDFAAAEHCHHALSLDEGADGVFLGKALPRN